MPKTELLARLKKLHEELSSIKDELQSEEVDEETVAALGQLVTDSSQLVERAVDANETDDKTESNELLDRVKQFESEHPRVSQFLTEMTDMLNMMGI